MQVALAVRPQLPVASGDMDWQNAATALASRVQYERCLGRSPLVREEVVKVFVAEIMQSLEGGVLDPEYNHPDLPGDTRIDIALRDARSKDILLGLELKWVRRTTETTARNWMGEIVRDVLRMERISRELGANAERAVVVVGEVDWMKSKVWSVLRIREAGARVTLADGLLQVRGEQLPADWATIDLQNCNAAYRRMVRFAGQAFLGSLPSTYLFARLVAYHVAAVDGVRAAIWAVKPVAAGRTTFDATVTWGAPPAGEDEEPPASDPAPQQRGPE